MVARFECDDGRTAGGAGTRPAQRHRLGMRTTGRLGCTDACDLTVAVQDDRADRRIRICCALDQLGLLDSQPHRGVETHSRR
jgi:hypothetical protein